MAQAKYRGRFVWQELMTEDTAAATTFYTKLLGWNAHPSEVDSSYLQLGVGSRGVAGLMKLPDSAKSMGAKPMWMSYITVDEVDPAVTQLQGLGGKVVRPAMDIPTVGRFAVVADPQGAVFALFKPDGPPPGPVKAPEPGEFSWMELATTDSEAAFTFYSKLFGWQALDRHDMGPMGTYLIFGSDGVQQGGIFKLGPDRGSTPHWLAYVAVADADVSAKEIPGLGGRVLNGPMDVPDGGRIVQLADPQGVMFALHSQTTPKVATPPAKPAAPAPSSVPRKPVPPKAVTPKPVPPKPVAPRPAAPTPAAAAPAKTAPAQTAAAKPAAKPAAKKVTKTVAKPATKKKVAKKATKKVAKKKLAKKTVTKKTVTKKVSKPVPKKKPGSAKGTGPARKSAEKPAKKDKKHKKKDKKKNKKNKKNKKSGKGKRKK